MGLVGNSFFQISMHHLSRATLYIWYQRWIAPMIKCVIIFSYSARPFRFFWSQEGIQMGMWIELYLCLYQVIHSSNESAVPLGLWVCFWVTGLARESGLEWVVLGASTCYLVFPSGHRPHCVGQGTNIRILPVTRYIYSRFIPSEAGNHKMDLSFYGTQTQT